MAANGFTIVENNPSAKRNTGVGRHEMKEIAAGNNGEMKFGSDDFGDGIVYLFGRGETDKNITYVALKNTGGTLCFIYPNAAGTGIVVTPTKP
jgi:hypothetical protein